MISFNIELPKNPLYCPKLSCDCYDYVYKGWNQPLVGTFSIGIGEIMHEIANERDEDIKESEQIIDFLRNRLQGVEKGSIIAEDEKEGDASRPQTERDQ